RRMDEPCRIDGKAPTIARNNHSTVKPVTLMAFLIALACPEGGTVLDPFAGSGTTGCAAVQLDRHYILIEQDAGYCEIARARIAAAVAGRQARAAQPALALEAPGP
ncbi:MAG TPA: site-specific DNA-methyltransferase, partial [Phycisphaerae bacterium]|nr:site-specific DNA-methyltransferase [Phycisphaerae bacterium]